MKHLSLFLLLILLFFSCKENKNANPHFSHLTAKQTTLKYAKGFKIKNYTNYTVLEITQPWPNAQQQFKYILTDTSTIKEILKKDAYNGIITTPIQKIVVTSTTHIPALELLGVEKTLIGFPGTNYISSKSIRTQIKNGKTKELGKNEALNTEALLALNPNIVVGFGIDGSNRSLEIIKKSGIPVIINGDWVESSPLAKAEWIKFFGVLYNKEKKADSIFNTIEKNYLEAKALAKKVKQKPTVLSGAIHNGIWYLPYGTSTEGQLLKDANVNYLWKKTKGSGSLKLNLESVLVKARNADIWLSPSYYTSMENLENGNKNHTLFKAFKNKNVYSFTNTTGVSGGVLYYELGMSRPDLVLKDIIKICHQDLLKEYQPFFFKHLK